MILDKFLWCPSCNELHQVSHLDRVSVTSASVADLRPRPPETSKNFVKQHSSHILETLQGMGERGALRDPPRDLKRVEYIEVTNGRDWFVIRSSLNTDKESPSLTILPGRLTLRPYRVQRSL